MPNEFADSDCVYVDPSARKVVGPVVWTAVGKAKPLVMPDKEEAPAPASDKDKKPVYRRKRKRMYPWCTYRTAKRVYRVEGKQKEEEKSLTLDEAMEKAQKETYWN